MIPIRIQQIDLNRYARTIITSDIHGDYDGFMAMLHQVRFSHNDVLIIVGDILEKGDQSLKLLQAIYQLQKEYAIILVLGNNDTFFEEWNHQLFNASQLYGYIQTHPHSIFHECALDLNIDVCDAVSTQHLMDGIFNTYQAELTYLATCPHILESDDFICVHAGISSLDLATNDIDTCLTTPEFGSHPHKFPKKVIVGHWPASNYCDDIIKATPYFHDNNIISIDGGNSMKRWGQINYLIYQNHQLEIGFYDNLPQVQLSDAQAESKDYYSVQFPKTEVKVLSQEVEFIECEIIYSHQKIKVTPQNFYHYKGKNYISDITTYQPELKEDEVVSLCRVYDDHILIKKDGVIGMYKGNYKFFNTIG